MDKQLAWGVTNIVSMEIGNIIGIWYAIPGITIIITSSISMAAWMIVDYAQRYFKRKK